MALSIGIDYKVGNWKTCLAENGQTLELLTLNDAQSTCSYIEQTCARYPEPVIGFSSQLGTSFVPLRNAAQMQGDLKAGEEAVQRDLQDLLRATTALNLKSYSLPGVKYLPSVPHYRRLKQGHMGTSDRLCSVATLVYRMRQQDAAWPEMRFLYLEAGPTSHSITVIENGRIVDGIGKVYALADEEATQGDVEQAFWEGLVQDLSGLMAIHHFEDVVLVDHVVASEEQEQRSTVVEHLGDNYQFYLFPRQESEPEGFEAAIGAAILAEGLHQPGLAAEVTEHLLSSLAQP
jgi:predicted butyrate kinase (DUF1464 family)